MVPAVMLRELDRRRPSKAIHLMPSTIRQSHLRRDLVQVQPLQPQSQSSAPGWPNYAYPEYNNPYYDGSSPGKMVSGAIDWALSFPSSVWDQFSGYLDSKLFPKVAGHVWGQISSGSACSSAESGREPPNLPPANSYTPDGR